MAHGAYWAVFGEAPPLEEIVARGRISLGSGRILVHALERSAALCFEVENAGPGSYRGGDLGRHLSDFAVAAAAVSVSGFADGPADSIDWFKKGRKVHSEAISPGDGEGSRKMQDFARVLGFESWPAAKARLAGPIVLELDRENDFAALRSELERLRGESVPWTAPEALGAIAALRDADARHVENRQARAEAREGLLAGAGDATLAGCLGLPLGGISGLLAGEALAPRAVGIAGLVGAALGVVAMLLVIRWNRARVARG